MLCAASVSAMEDTHVFTHLKKLESEAIHIMREVAAEAENLPIAESAPGDRPQGLS